MSLKTELELGYKYINPKNDGRYLCDANLVFKARRKIRPRKMFLESKGKIFFKKKK